MARSCHFNLDHWHDAGAVIWSYLLFYRIGGDGSDPAVDDDRSVVYVANGNGVQCHLYALNTANGTVKWIFSSPDTGNTGALVVGLDGTLYFSAGTAMYAVASDWGSSVWTYGPGCTPLAGAIIDASGTLYFVCSDNNTVSPAVLAWSFKLKAVTHSASRTLCPHDSEVTAN